MKKKLSIILSVLLCLTMCLSGCGSYPNKRVSEVPDASYAVIGNGGVSVQQGKYLYFINGYNEIEDSEAKTNQWGKVVKGGIYRIDMTGGKDVTVSADLGKVASSDSMTADPYLGYYGGDYKTVVSASVPGVKKTEADDYSGFDMVTKKDLDEKEYAAIEATPIVPKKVTNAGTEAGGIYIFENWIYYTTPLEKKNKEGEVQYDLTAFMRTRLNGTGTEVIYETTDKDAALKYGYYRYNKKTYLTVLDGGVLKSITCKDGGGKSTVYTIAENVDSVLFSNKPVYYTGMREDGVEDFIYYTIEAGNDDQDPVNPNGAVLMRVRPDATQGLRLSNDGNRILLRTVMNGYLYYYKVDASSNGTLYANDLAAYPTEEGASAKGESDVFEFDAIGNYSTLYVGNTVNSYDPETKTSRVSHFALVGRNGRTELIKGKGTESQVIDQAETITVIGMDGDIVYYFVDDRTDAENHPDLEVVVQKLRISEAYPVIISMGKAIVGNFLTPDVTAGYLFYAATESTVPYALDKNTDEGRKVSGYMHVRRVDGFGDDESESINQVQEPEWTIEAFDPEDEKEVEKSAETETAA